MSRCGETPYNIDISNQKTILGQVFGARKLNTNEDSENMLGYDLYSSALADILTEPSLSTPITLRLVSSYSYSTVSYLLALTEVILVIMKMDGLRHGLVVSGLTNSTALVGSEQPSLADMESLVVSLLVTLAVILWVIVVANLYRPPDHQRPTLLPANSLPAIRDQARRDHL